MIYSNDNFNEIHFTTVKRFRSIKTGSAKFTMQLQKSKIILVLLIIIVIAQYLILIQPRYTNSELTDKIGPIANYFHR